MQSVNLLIDEISQPITLTQPAYTLTVNAPLGDNTIDITQLAYDVDIITYEPTVTVLGETNVSVTLNEFAVNLDVEGTVVTLDLTVAGDTSITITEGENNVSVETQTQTVEILSGFGTGLIEFDEAIAEIYAFYGQDIVNVISNSRFFTTLDGWDIDGCNMTTGIDPNGPARVQNDDPDVPPGIPYQYVARMGGKYSKYIGKRLTVVTGQRIYGSVLSVTPVPITAQTLYLKAHFYNDANTFLGEVPFGFRTPSATPGSMSSIIEVPLYTPSAATQCELVLETDAPDGGFDTLKRWYFTNAQLFDVSSTDALSASITNLTEIVDDPVTGITAQWGIQVDVNNRITGTVKLSATESESEFAVVADKFTIADPSNTGDPAETVFEIVGGVVKLRELVANDITSTTISVKNNGAIKVFDSQTIPVTRVEIGKIGSDYGLLVRDAAGNIIFNVDSLGVNVVGTTNIIAGAVTPGKTNIPAINSGSGNLNANTVDTAQIIAGAISSANLFSTSIRPVEYVTSLPVSGNFAGRTVYLSTDSKIYRYDGSVYTASVPTIDLSGQITTTQITDNAITSVKIAANTITAGDIAANTITAGQIAANTITAGQIAAATITASQIAANTITASRLLLTDTENRVLDPYGLDINYWFLSGGMTRNTADTAVLAAMNVPCAFKTATGNGTTSQTESVAGVTPAAAYASVEANKPYRISAVARVKAGFTGRVYAVAYWFDNTKTYLNASTSIILGDYRTVAAVSDTTLSDSAIGNSHAQAAYVRVDLVCQWSITQNNAQHAYLSHARLMRAANAELIVDGTITASKIAANTITAAQIAANTITATQIAAGTITATQIAAGTITATQIAAGTITAAQIAAGTITANEIAAGTITAAKLNVTTLSAIAADVGTLTAGEIRNAASTFRIDVTNGRTITQNGAYMKVTGIPFGSSSQFIEWYGPYFANLSSCTEANAVYYLKTNGSAYFGGTLSAGVLKNEAQTTSLSGTAFVIIGPFLTNGGTKNITVSYAYSYSYCCDYRTGAITGAATPAVVTVEKSIAGGLWTSVGTLTAYEVWRDVTIGDTPGISPDNVEYAIAGSTTMTDNEAATSQMRLRASITTPASLPRFDGDNQFSNLYSQNISIISVE